MIDSPRTTVHAARQAAYEELQAVAGGLISEFAGHIPAGNVLRQLAVAREHLLAAGVRSGLAAAAEAMARLRLEKLVPPHGVTG